MEAEKEIYDPEGVTEAQKKKVKIDKWSFVRDIWFKLLRLTRVVSDLIRYSSLLFARSKLALVEVEHEFEVAVQFVLLHNFALAYSSEHISKLLSPLRPKHRNRLVGTVDDRYVVGQVRFHERNLRLFILQLGLPGSLNANRSLLDLHVLLGFLVQNLLQLQALLL